MSERISFYLRRWAGVAALACAVAAEGAPVIGPATAVPVDVDAGERLFIELNCASCHAGSRAIQPRLAGPKGPLLGKDGLRLTPQFIRAYLADPHTEKPNGLMPDIMHGVPDKARDPAIEALTHFLLRSQMESATEEKTVSAQAGRINEGKELYHRVGCVACHAPLEGAVAPALASESVPFGNLAKKMTVPEMAKFLREPLKYRPGGRMPSLKLTESESLSIAMYLLRAQAPDPNAPSVATNKVAGLQYEYFEGGGNNWDFDARPAVSSGIADGFNLKGRKREQDFAMRFNGLIKAPKTGTYAFWTRSDDGTRLFIDGKKVVENWGDHAPEERKGAIELTEGDHEISLQYFNNVAGHELAVFWQPPEGARAEIPAEVLSHVGRPMLPLEGEEFKIVEALAERGEQLFNSMNCSGCHDNADTPAYAINAKLFKDMAATGGCLEEEVAIGLPDYQLNATQRQALQKFLEQREALEQPLTEAQEITRTLASLNCYACHTRDAKGGPADARLEFFKVNGEADLGDEGRIPPHLTKVGAKLRKDWIKTVTQEGGAVRPYMATRMPQFGEAHVGRLADLFAKVDDTAESKRELNGTERDEKFGRRLVGVGGLACVQCHTFAGRKSLGIPAMDLTMMTTRLQPDWFYRYLINPPSLRPGTRMPTFWPEGEAANKEILDGKTDAQITAIWAYLGRGREADLPPGLVTGKQEIVADKEAVIYRNFIQGAGTRGIGVGYPEKANLAFDANASRIAMLWQGAFIDAARHSNGRGEGFEGPLGDRILRMPEGPTIAKLAADDEKWPTESKAKFGGYKLDEKQRPTFLYRVSEISVEDFPAAMETDLDPYFQRTIKLRGEGEGLWFRAAVAEKIEPQESGLFKIDDRTTIKISGAEARVREADGKKELVAPIQWKEGAAEIVEEIRW